MPLKAKKPSTLIVTDEMAIAHTPSRSYPRIAKVLGRDIVAGVETIWLDRLIQEPDEEFEGWSVCGAISSIVRRVP